MQCFSRYFIYNIVIIITISMCTALSYETAFCSTDADKTIIILDPGHGGFDYGARGADKSLEKDIVLSAANKLKEILKINYTVVLTRTDDYWVNIKKRTEAANNLNAKLFISFHTGASFARETKGMSLIYYKPVTLKNEKRSSGETSLKKAGWDSVQEKHIPLSRIIAESLYTRFSRTNTYGNPKTEALALSVLSGANMPAIQIEIGHLTNPSEEQQLNNSDYMSDYMKEIASEINLFLKKYKNLY